MRYKTVIIPTMLTINFGKLLYNVPGHECKQS